MKFPRTVEHGKGRNKVQVVIYGKKPNYPFYRISYYEGGRRILRTFSTYTKALAEAETKAEALSKKGKGPALSDRQITDAVAAIEALQGHHDANGKPLSLLVVVQEYIHAVKKVDCPLSTAIDSYLSTSATVKRVPIKDAVTEYLTGMQEKTKADAGQRPKLSLDYYNHLEKELNTFAETLPNYCVAHLNKDLLAIFTDSLSNLAPKTRNHYKAAVRDFIRWAVAQDYLHTNHRLLERRHGPLSGEKAEGGEIEIYTSTELQTLLNAAGEELRICIAVMALAGVRELELRRLTWEEVYRIPNQIEITAQKAKTRQRRLVPIVTSLASWLTACKTKKTGLVWGGTVSTFQKAITELCEDCNVKRRNNGFRHSFISYRLASVHDSARVALETGTSQQIIFKNYRELVTEAEAENWFNVAPAQP